MEEAMKAGTINECEIFLFTDNWWVLECAYTKEYSDSFLLYELVLHLRMVAMKSGATHHMIHITGMRMIEQDSDGLSWGDLQKGVMGGQGMKEFIILHLDAFQQSKQLKGWVDSWTSGTAPVHYLTPTE